MSGPIQGNYTAAQLNELQEIWSNLPDANSQTLNDDISKLKQLLASFPTDSSQAQALGNALVNLQAAAQENYTPGLFIDNAENAIAVTISPQLPTILTPGMQSTLQNMLNSNPTPAQLNQYLSELTTMLIQVQGMPNSPQQNAAVYQLQNAIQGLTGYIGGGSNENSYAIEFFNSVQNLIGLPQGPKAPGVG